MLIHYGQFKALGMKVYADGCVTCSIRHRCGLPVISSPVQGGKFPLPGDFMVILIDFISKSVF